jgi:hypothetical protein
MDLNHTNPKAWGDVKQIGIDSGFSLLNVRDLGYSAITSTSILAVTSVCNFSSTV